MDLFPENKEHSNLPRDSKATLTGIGSDTHLNAFLRGEISQEVVPPFCDTSFFTTIVSHARKQPNVQVEDCHSALKSLQVKNDDLDCCYSWHCPMFEANFKSFYL